MPHYTLKEMIDLMEPQAVRDKSLIVRCIGGLTQYAAELRQRAIPNEQTRIPILRELVSEMAAYWNLEEFSDGGTPEAYQKDFDSRVAGAERAGEPLATTHELSNGIRNQKYIRSINRSKRNLCFGCLCEGG